MIKTSVENVSTLIQFWPQNKLCCAIDIAALVYTVCHLFLFHIIEWEYIKEKGS